ncbi:ferritin-like domain-containing protein [bacterium]|nr:MAG: ferritin-like domain-containing protein [bacterium]
METLQELFEDSIKDVYSAEKQFLKAMPKLAKAAQAESVKEAINGHIEMSKGQVERLEKIGELGGFKLTGKVCKAAQGLVEEAEEHLSEGKPGPVLDAAIVACAQKNEHYEIGTYGTIIAWGQQLGMKEAVALLKETLAEEESTDKLLSGVAKKGVNQAAAEVEAEEAPKAKK